MRTVHQIVLKDYQEFHMGTEFLGISKRNFKKTPATLAHFKTVQSLDEVSFETT